MSFLRFLVGLFLLPCAAAATRLVVTEISGAASFSAPLAPLLLMATGVFGMAFLFAILPAPVRLYVLAHELTHALWALFFGAHVSRLRVSGSGGSVNVSERNWLIVLAPYFFPFYTALILVAYGVIGVFADLRPYNSLWFVLIGMSLGFHWSFTVFALARGQQDVREYGRFFSFVVIYLINILVLGLILLPFCPMSFWWFLTRLIVESLEICGWVLQQLAAGAGWIFANLNKAG